MEEKISKVIATLKFKFKNITDFNIDDEVNTYIESCDENEIERTSTSQLIEDIKNIMIVKLAEKN